MKTYSFKYVSGDFVAEYNTLMEGLKKAQAELDESYGRSVQKLLAMETARLEEVVPMPYQPGDIVTTIDGRKGKVLACPIDITLNADEAYSGPLFGPAKYLDLDDDYDWEEVITCEGMMRKITVELEPSEFEKDWGHDKIIESFWPDEVKGSQHGISRKCYNDRGRPMGRSNAN